MAASDLISREAAVREALRCYRGAQEAVRQCRDAEDDFGTLAFEGQKEALSWMVMALMTLPESDAVQVVRCENCLYACKIDGQPHIRICANTGILVSLDYFCPRGRCLGGADDA